MYCAPDDGRVAHESPGPPAVSLGLQFESVQIVQGPSQPIYFVLLTDREDDGRKGMVSNRRTQRCDFRLRVMERRIRGHGGRHCEDFGAAAPALLTAAAYAVPDKYSAAAAEQIMKLGGNAVDAAVAIAFTLAVTYPEAGNIEVAAS